MIALTKRPHLVQWHVDYRRVACADAALLPLEVARRRVGRHHDDAALAVGYLRLIRRRRTREGQIRRCTDIIMAGAAAKGARQ